MFRCRVGVFGETQQIRALFVYVQSKTSGSAVARRNCGWPREAVLEEAVIEIGERCEFISAETAKQLRDELGLRVVSKNSKHGAAKPHWNDSTGELTFDSEIVRRVRLTSQPSNVRTILRAFQKEKWRRRIENPLVDQHCLHQTLRSLNKGLQKLRFRAAEAKYAFWEVTSQ